MQRLMDSSISFCAASGYEPDCVWRKAMQTLSLPCNGMASMEESTGGGTAESDDGLTSSAAEADCPCVLVRSLHSDSSISAIMQFQRIKQVALFLRSVARNAGASWRSQSMVLVLDELKRLAGTDLTRACRRQKVCFARNNCGAENLCEDNKVLPRPLSHWPSFVLAHASGGALRPLAGMNSI